MFAPLFQGMAPLPPRRIRHNEEFDAPATAADVPRAPSDPGTWPPFPPSGRAIPNNPRNPPPPESVIQPPGAIVIRPRLGVPPAREPLEPSSLENEALQLPGTSTAPLMSVSGDIFSGGSPFLSPGVFIPNVGLTQHNQFGVIPKPYAMVAYNIFYDPALQKDFVGLMYLSGGQFGLFGIIEQQNAATVALAFMANNYASLGFSHIAVNNYLVTAYSAFLVGWRDYIGLTGQYVWADHATNTLLFAGGLAAKTARRDVFDLGTYRGKSVRQLAASHNIPDGTPLRRIEVRRRTGNTLQLRAGGGLMTISGMVRFDANTNTDVSYRTFVTPRQARDLLFEGSGPWLFLKNKARALGWAKDPMTFPNHLVPENIPLGDEVQIVKSGTYVLGLLVGQLAGWATTQAWFRSDVEYTIRRIGESTMEVTLTPIKLRSASAYAVDPFGPHAASRATRAMVSRQTLLFDLSEPLARQAYTETIGGRLPQVVPKMHTFSRRALTPGQVSQAVRAKQNALPRGVTRTFVHTLEGSLTDIGGGLKWLLIPTEVLPKGFQLALTTHRQRAHENQTVTDGAMHYNAEGFSHLAVTERLNGGRKSVYTLAQQHSHGRTGAKPTFDELRITSTFNDTRLRGNNLNRRLVGTLTQRFNAIMGFAEGKHEHEERQMQIQRKLDSAALAQLAGWHAHYAAQDPTLGGIRIQRTARATGVSYRNIDKFLTQMRAAQSDSDRSIVLQKFVQSHHIKGFAAVHALLDNDFGRVEISTNSSAYDGPLTLTESLCLKYLDPITAQTAPDAIAKRYRDVEKALRLVDKARTEVADDPLMENARDYYLMMLNVSEERLHALLVMPHARAFAVQQSLSKKHIKHGWHARVREAVTPMDALLDPLQQLQVSAQDMAVPNDAATFVERYRQMYYATVRITKHLRYLKKDGILLPKQQRYLNIAQLEQARRLLIGDGPFHEHGPYDGLMNVGTLTPQRREQLLSALHQFKKDAPLAALKKQLA